MAFSAHPSAPGAVRSVQRRMYIQVAYVLVFGAINASEVGKVDELGQPLGPSGALVFVQFALGAGVLGCAWALGRLLPWARMASYAVEAASICLAVYSLTSTSNRFYAGYIIAGVVLYQLSTADVAGAFARGPVAAGGASRTPQPQFAAGVYGQPQPAPYGAPSYGPPSYGAPSYGAPQAYPGTAPPPAPQYDAPPFGAQPFGAQPFGAQPHYGAQPATPPWDAQPYAAQLYAAQPYTAQPYTAQPHAAQPHAAQPHAAQPHAAQPHAAQPYAAQPPAAAWPGQPAPQADPQGPPRPLTTWRPPTPPRPTDPPYVAPPQ